MTNSSRENSLVHLLAVALVFALACDFCMAASYNLTVKGSDAIYLAGRNDVVVPPLDFDAGFILKRHNYSPPFPPDFVQETHPQWVAVTGGDVVKVADPAIGGIHFYNGFGTPFGPEGNTPLSSLTPLAGLSGWSGTQGPLTGVFLTNANPVSASPPATLNFSTPAARDFLTLSPELGQVFFIGDGVTSGGLRQEFIAPAGATRLFVGIPDGFGFNGPPGAYEDNDGQYQIILAINEEPILPSGEVPEPMTAAGVLLGLGGLGRYLRRRRA